jgi:hypothetical protein
VKTLQDATISLGALKETNVTYNNKAVILKALAENDIAT